MFVNHMLYHLELQGANHPITFIGITNFASLH